MQKGPGPNHVRPPRPSAISVLQKLTLEISPPPGAGGLGGWVVGGVAGWLAGLAGWLAGMGKVMGFDYVLGSGPPVSCMMYVHMGMHMHA